MIRISRRHIGVSSYSLLAALALSPAAIAAPAGVAFDVRAGPLGPALLEYARQAHRQVLYDATLVAGRSTPGLKGRFSEDEALSRLLAGSRIIVDHTSANGIVLKPAADPAPVADAAAAPPRGRRRSGAAGRHGRADPARGTDLAP